MNLNQKQKKGIRVAILVVCILIVAFGMNYVGKVSVCKNSEGILQGGRCLELDYLGVCSLKKDTQFIPAIFENETMDIIEPANDSNILNN